MHRKAVLSKTRQHPLPIMASNIWVRGNSKNRTSTAISISENILEAFCTQQSVSWHNHRPCILHILFYHALLEPYLQHDLIRSHSWQCSRLCAVYTRQAMRSLFFCYFIPFTSKLLWNGFILAGIAMGGGALPSTTCAPRLHIGIQLLAHSESLHFIDFPLSCLFLPRCCMFLWLQDCLIPSSTEAVSFLFKMCSWSDDMFCWLFQRTVFLWVWLSDGWK